jgi:hypothetical protein
MATTIATITTTAATIRSENDITGAASIKMFGQI